MSVIAIVGAGTLGGTLAQTLAVRGLCHEIRLLDAASDVAAGKALDIRQAGPIDRFDTRLAADRPPAGLADADVVVLAGPVTPDAEWDDEAGLAQLQQVAAANQQAPVICAGAGHCRLVARGVSDAALHPRRLIGSAPEALRAALRAIVALDVECPASEVALTLLGAPPDHVVVPWSQATAGGLSIEALLPPARLARLRDRVAALWPPGPYALAAAAAHVVSTALTGSGHRPSCFVVVEDTPAPLAMPVALDRSGVARILQPPLTERERGELQGARGD